MSEKREGPYYPSYTHREIVISLIQIRCGYSGDKLEFKYALGARARMSEREEAPLCHRFIRPLVSLGGSVGFWDISIEIGGGGERTRVSEKEEEPLSPRCIRPLMFPAEIGKLSAIELGGGRMDTSVRRG